MSTGTRLVGMGPYCQHRLSVGSCIWLGDVCERDTMDSLRCALHYTLSEYAAEITLCALASSGKYFLHFGEKAGLTNL